MPGRIFVLLAVVMAFAAFSGAPATARAQAPAGPALETPSATLAAALQCPDPLTNLARNPVLLVPGTGLNGNENWEWSYMPALKAQGFATCTLDLPGSGMGDIQVAAEYIVYAIKKMSADSGDKVAVVGYSQGGLDIRWALKYWPELRPLVSDFVGIAPANHGADSAAALCSLPAGCGPSILQMAPGSRLLRALDSGAQVFAPIDYTMVYSNTDGTVIPPAARSSLTAAGGVNVSNVAIQDICPANKTVHIGIPADGVVYALVLDALLRPGAADPARIGADVCGTFVPGVTAEIATAKEAELNGLAFPRVLGYPAAKSEPALKAYASAPLPPNTGNTGPAADTRIWTVALALALVATGVAGGVFAARTRRVASRVRTE